MKGALGSRVNVLDAELGITAKNGKDMANGLELKFRMCQYRCFPVSNKPIAIFSETSLTFIFYVSLIGEHFQIRESMSQNLKEAIIQAQDYLVLDHFSLLVFWKCFSNNYYLIQKRLFLRVFVVQSVSILFHSFTYRKPLNSYLFFTF